MEQELSIDRFRRSRKRLRIGQWSGLVVVALPFFGLATYEQVVEDVGLWRFFFAVTAAAGVLITFVCRIKEKQLIAHFFAD